MQFAVFGMLKDTCNCASSCEQETVAFGVGVWTFDMELSIRIQVIRLEPSNHNFNHWISVLCSHSTHKLASIDIGKLKHPPLPMAGSGPEVARAALRK